MQGKCFGPRRAYICKESGLAIRTGKLPIEIGPRRPSGGSVGYELGASAPNIAELRDGCVLNRDFESVSPTEVTMRINS